MGDCPLPPPPPGAAMLQALFLPLFMHYTHYCKQLNTMDLVEKSEMRNLEIEPYSLGVCEYL